MEEEIWRYGSTSTEGIQSSSGRKQKVETDDYRKKALKPCERKELATEIISAESVSVSRACKIVCLPRSMYYYQSVKDDGEVIAKLNDLAERYPTRGFDNYYGKIRNEDLKWNRIIPQKTQCYLVRRFYE